MNIISVYTLELLIVVFLILPLYHRVLLWVYLWQWKEYNIRKIRDFLTSIEGKHILFSKYFFIEVTFIIVFIVLQLVLHEDIYEYFTFLVFTYLFLLTIYDFLKIITRNFTKLKFTIKSTLIIIFTILLYTCYFSLIKYYEVNYLSLFLLISLLLVNVFVFISVLFINPIVLYEKKRKIKLAVKKISNQKKLLTIYISGSYNRISIKEFLFQILSNFFNVQKNLKNNNTEIGIAKTILNELKTDTQIFIVDIETYKKGVIASIANILNPKIAILTGIDEKYMSFFNSMEDIINSKLEVFYNLPSDGIFYCNIDDDNIANIDLPDRFTVYRYGIRRDSDLHCSIIQMNEDGTIFNFSYKEYTKIFNTNIFGSQNILSLIPCIGISIELGVSIDDLIDVISHLQQPDSLYKIIKYKSNILIDNSSNVSYTSLIHGILDLEYITKTKKILVLDDILELGNKTKDIYNKIGNILANLDFYYIILIGKNYSNDLYNNIVSINENYKEKILFIKDYEKINDILLNIDDTVVLFDGYNSRKYLNFVLNAIKDNV